MKPCAKVLAAVAGTVVLIPMALARRLPKIRYCLARCWWRLRHPVTSGARVILSNEAGEICLVRHTYGSGWYLPGGGVKRGEGPEEAAYREVWEELRVEVDEVHLVGTYTNTAEAKRDTIWVFMARARSCPTCDGTEVAEWGWFGPTDLPSGTSPGTRRRLEEHFGRRQRTGAW